MALHRPQSAQRIVSQPARSFDVDFMQRTLSCSAVSAHKLTSEKHAKDFPNGVVALIVKCQNARRVVGLTPAVGEPEHLVRWLGAKQISSHEYYYYY